MSKPETSSRRVTTVALRNALAVVSVAVALGLALVARSHGIQHVEFPLLLMAVAVAVWYAGAVLEPSDRPVFVVFLLFALTPSSSVI